MPTGRPSGFGSGGCLVRLAVMAAIVWYGGRWLLSIPEVRTLVDAFLAGSFSDDQVNAAINALRAHVQQLFGVSSSTR